jgi:hypothetical protein
MERIRYGRYRPCNDSRTIEFPETINMNKFLDEGEGTEDYRLIAVASHIGRTPITGHYISFCAVHNRWCKFNGESVEVVASEAVFEENLTRTFPDDELQHESPLQTASLLLYEAGNTVNT